MPYLIGTSVKSRRFSPRPPRREHDFPGDSGRRGPSNAELLSRLFFTSARMMANVESRSI